MKICVMMNYVMRHHSKFIIQCTIPISTIGSTTIIIYRFFCLNLRAAEKMIYIRWSKRELKIETRETKVDNK